MPELYYAVHNDKFYNGSIVFADSIRYEWSKEKLQVLTLDRIKELVKEPTFPKTVNFYQLTTDSMIFP